MQGAPCCIWQQQHHGCSCAGRILLWHVLLLMELPQLQLQAYNTNTMFLVLRMSVLQLSACLEWFYYRPLPGAPAPSLSTQLQRLCAS
jgi:hypothetical protein